MRANSSRARHMGYAMILALATQMSVAENKLAAEKENPFIVLCYHSIPERYQGDPMSISATRFVEHVEWMRENGYSAISFNQVLAAKSGKIKLPQKSFLITVDDGYEDVYKNLFPLLKLYKLPAVIALVGKWIEDGLPSKNETDPHFSKQRFLSWGQIKEMTQSGLVEVASHSYDLHHGIVGNPQGNSQPAAVTLRFNSDLNLYETLEQRRTRIRADLERNSRLIQEQLGKRPRIMVWPYGAYDRVGIQEAARAGMTSSLTLDAEPASATNSEVIPRFLVNKEMPLPAFSYTVQHALQTRRGGPVRAIKLSLDRIHDSNAQKQNQKLGVLIENVRTLGLNTVVLQPFVQPEDGKPIEAVYFPNTVLPMRSDLLNRVAWQLKSRLGVTVYSLIPVSNLSVTENDTQRILDPANSKDLKLIFQLYEELSHYSHLHGVIFIENSSDAVGMQVKAGLLQQLRHHRSLPQPAATKDFYAISADAKQGWDFKTAYQSHPFAVIDVPPGLTSDNVRQFTQRLPAHYVTLLSLDAQDLNERHLQSLLVRIQLLKENGVHNFLLADDEFLSDPRQIDSLRAALSLKRNPYLEVGQ